MSTPITIPPLNINKAKSSRIPVPVSRASGPDSPDSPDKPRPDSPTIPKTKLRAEGGGDEALGFDPRTGVAIGGSSEGSSHHNGSSSSESGFDEEEDEEEIARKLDKKNGDAVEEMIRLLEEGMRLWRSD